MIWCVLHALCLLAQWRRGRNSTDPCTLAQSVRLPLVVSQDQPGAKQVLWSLLTIQVLGEAQKSKPKLSYVMPFNNRSKGWSKGQKRCLLNPTKVITCGRSARIAEEPRVQPYLKETAIQGKGCCELSEFCWKCRDNWCVVPGVNAPLVTGRCEWSQSPPCLPYLLCASRHWDFWQ